MKVTNDLAQQLVSSAPRPDTWSELREWVDQQTGRTLEWFDLDVLTGYLWQKQGKTWESVYGHEQT